MRGPYLATEDDEEIEKVNEDALGCDIVVEKKEINDGLINYGINPEIFRIRLDHHHDC